MLNVDPEDIDKLCTELKELIDSEISNGNSIVETSSAWPYKNGVNIWLERKFSKGYQYISSELQYEYLGDPHNGHSEYRMQSKNQLVICWGR